MASNRKSDWAILIGVTVVVCLVRYNFGLERYLGNLLNMPQGGTPGNGPGGDPPFYFLRQDFLDGMCAATAMVLATVLIACTWRLNRRASCQGFYMAWIWCMPGALRGLIIGLRCPHLMDAQRAVSPWATFDQFLSDPLIEIAMWGSLLLALATLFIVRKRFGAEQPTTTTAIASPR